MVFALYLSSGLGFIKIKSNRTARKQYGLPFYANEFPESMTDKVLASRSPINNSGSRLLTCNVCRRGRDRSKSMDSNTVKKLVDEARTGSKEAFDELVRITYPRLLKKALSATGNIEDARDALQDAYIRAFRSLTTFRGDASFFKWMQTIVANASSTLVAKARRRRFELISGSYPQNDVIEPFNDSNALEKDSMFILEFNRALKLLPEILRNVVILKDVYGLEHKEIADELGISESNAKVRLHRARKLLKSHLQPPLANEPVIYDDPIRQSKTN